MAQIILLSLPSLSQHEPMHLASRNINDWWLAYWISHTHTPSNTTNISAYNISLPSNTPGAIPLLPVISASDNMAFYLGIYGGLAAANSVSWRKGEIIAPRD